MPPRMRGTLRVVKNIVLTVLSLAVVAGGVYVSVYYMQHRPKPQRKAPPPMAPLVQVQELQAESHQVVVKATGTVIPAVEVTVKPRVTGQVISLHPDFREGGLVKAGEVLVRLDPRDYELAIAADEAQLETARYEYKAEQGKQDVAKREWDLLDMKQDAADLDEELALRQPQLRQKEAQLKAAESALEEARLALERTTIKAPCNGVILSANVDIGDQATSQSTLATLVGSDAYWVRVSIPADELKWLVLPRSSKDPASTAWVYNGRGAPREGRVISLYGDLEENGRLAQLLVEVKDPLELGVAEDRNPLLLNEFVRVELLGRTVDDVFAIPRDALRDGNNVWLSTPEDTLLVQAADIVWADTQQALLRGLQNGDRLIISDLAGPVDGMSVQLQDAPEPSGDSGAPRERPVSVDAKEDGHE